MDPRLKSGLRVAVLKSLLDSCELLGEILATDLFSERIETLGFLGDSNFLSKSTPLSVLTSPSILDLLKLLSLVRLGSSSDT